MKCSGTGKWIGYQILAGAIGAAFMVPYMASYAFTCNLHRYRKLRLVSHRQILLPAEDRAAGATATVFGQTLGATIFVSIANAVYQNKLLQGIESIPGLDVAAVTRSGVSAFRDIVPADLLPQVIQVAADVSFPYVNLMLHCLD